MKVAAIKNIEIENLGNLRYSLEKRGIEIEEFSAYSGDIPKVENFDVLIVLGGPMGVYEEGKYPFLREEKKLIKEALSKGKKILGICLGAQLLADVLGGKVYKGEWGKEIGWYPIYPQDHLEILYSDEITVFHWHGDTFELPESCVRMASSQMYKNQAFRLGNQAVGLQFHLEVTPEVIESWISSYRDELKSEGIEVNRILGNDALWKKLKIYCDVFTEYFLRL